MSNKISFWAATAIERLTGSKDEPLHQYEAGGFQFELKMIGDSVWMISAFGGKCRLGLRLAYSPDGFDDIKITHHDPATVSLRLSSAAGKYQIDINWPDAERPTLHYTTSLQPSQDLSVPFWPRDIIAYGGRRSSGEVFISQVGTRSGLLYASFKDPAAGSFLYLQNLTALGAYNIDTETSAGNIVGGEWPEMGLSLPPALKKPLQKNKKYTVSDAFIAFSELTPKDQFEVAKGFLDALAGLYLLMPRPEAVYHDYLEVLPKALHDLETNKGCWAHRSGHPYLNAYLCDYQTPPEIMVQLAVLLPVRDYMKWSGEKCTLAQQIIDGLSAFYSEELRTVMRWLPSEEDRLDKSEEQKKPLVMDSWYLHHPLLNLARMASDGDKLAKDLLMRSVDYAIKVARHFKYCWPVFYKMDTLEVIKAETKLGEGGEKDVAGLYAHVMLQVWELTKEKKYFDEAERAALSMTQHGFNVLYQANNTMFAAKAMILLYKETKKEIYRDLSYLFMANIFKNVALWECNYGFGKNFPTFFQLYPLSDAPYTAVYEEQEAYAGVHEFLNYAEGVDLLPSLRLLLAEFARYAVHRMIYYYPPMLPGDMLAEKPKTGELDPKLWVALEDIHDGWEPSGSVGQEVYGAGLAFGIVPRQYIRIPGQHFMVFTDYPVLGQKIRSNTLHFTIQGDARLSCRLSVVTTEERSLPAIKIKTGKGSSRQEVKPVSKHDHNLEFSVAGDQEVTVSWG